MTGLLTTARIACKSPEARDTTIAAFRDIIAYTIPNEPDVLQYICAVPLDDASKTEIYMIEEYAHNPSVPSNHSPLHNFCSSVNI